MYNLILDTDSYKTSHYKQYPPGAKRIFSYIEARDNAEFDEVCFFGLQYFLKRYLSRGFTRDNIEEAENVFSLHGVPFNSSGWHDLLDRYGGTLPIDIKAVPEGTVLKKGNVLVTIESTDGSFPWLISYIETALLRAVWYPTTVATISREAKKVIKKFLDETCDHPDVELPFKLHDFGARGVSSYESAGVGGAAHLINFMGTDTVPALSMLRKYYNTTEMPGFSIPAMEHSTVCSWGKEGEKDAYRNMLEAYGAEGTLLACVSDSYDIYNAVKNIWCSSEMRNAIKEKGCTVVIRPDSGDPVGVVLALLKILEKFHGTTTNSKGYRVLRPGFRLIQGDGMNLEMIRRVLVRMKDFGYSAENVAFGMGGGLLQCLNRDTLSFAMKTSAIKFNGGWIPVGKKPVTDRNKSQKFGRLTLRQNEEGEWYTSTDVSSWQDRALLWSVYKDGGVYSNYNLDNIRMRAAI